MNLDKLDKKTQLAVITLMAKVHIALIEPFAKLSKDPTMTEDGIAKIGKEASAEAEAIIFDYVSDFDPEVVRDLLAFFWKQNIVNELQSHCPDFLGPEAVAEFSANVLKKSERALEDPESVLSEVDAEFFHRTGTTLPA